MQQLIKIEKSDSITNGKTIFGYPDNQPSFTEDSLANVFVNEQQVVETFLQEDPVEITINTLQYESSDWVVYVLLFLTFGFSLIWYYLPERALGLFKFTEPKRDFKSRDDAYAETPGMMIFLFFVINYIITISLFLFLTLNRYYEFDKLIRNKFMVLIALSVLSFYLFRVFSIFFTGFIFNTKEAAGRQLKLYINIDNITGFLLIPVMYVMLFVQVDIVYYSGLIIIFILHIFKWFQSFIIGNSIPGFSILHLFMYLCTLEIIPLIILVKLFTTSLI